MINLKYRRYLTLYGIILLGLFMRLCDSPPSSLWTDEFATYWISSAPTLSECVVRATPTQGQSPFYYILEWGVLKNFTHNEFSLRLISLSASIISILLMFILALLIFSKNGIFYDYDDEEHKPLSLIETDAFYPAIFAAVVFAISESSIYYALEARPYALAVMFCLLSQIFFFRILQKMSIVNIVFYIIASSLICYTHYIFGTLLLSQNLWMLYLFLKPSKQITTDIQGKGRGGGLKELFKLNAGDISLPKWCILQIFVIITLLPLAFHLAPILSDADKWNWVPNGGFFDMMQIFTGMIDLKFTLYVFSLFLFLLTMKNLTFLWQPATKKDAATCSTCSDLFIPHNKKILIFLILWLMTPPLFAYLATQLMNSSLLDSRYMILVFLPYILLGALAISMLKTKIAKYLFIALVMFFYCLHTLIPNFLDSAHFAKRIPHNWRDALKYVKANIHPDDSIILRSGFIKENWIPETENEIIKEYVQAPLKSFYFKGATPKAVYNLTFSTSPKWKAYYQKISSMAAQSQRVWIIGISKPNDFPINNVPELLSDTHIVAFKKEYSGVFIYLMVKKMLQH